MNIIRTDSFLHEQAAARERESKGSPPTPSPDTVGDDIDAALLQAEDCKTDPRNFEESVKTGNPTAEASAGDTGAWHSPENLIVHPTLEGSQAEQILGIAAEPLLASLDVNAIPELHEQEEPVLDGPYTLSSEQERVAEGEMFADSEFSTSLEDQDALPSSNYLERDTKHLIPGESQYIPILGSSERWGGITTALANPVTELRAGLGRDNAACDSVYPETKELHTGLETGTPTEERPLVEGNSESPYGSLHDDVSDSGAVQKTELEREMELYEAAEREEEARLLTSLRSEQSGELSPSKQNSQSTEDTQSDRKRGLESAISERRPKRGRKALTSQPQKEEEDVCFVCFDGGKLILCDKRSCPKAYHIECTGRESGFFQKKGQWLCGWHVCAHCTRSASIHCYTCPHAFCHICVRDADFLCVTKDRGLCEVCYPIVKMIEHNETINSDGVQVDFDDQETYECLFKEYWEDLKQKLSLTLADLDRACKAKEAGELLENGGNEAEQISGDGDGSSTDSDGKPATRRWQVLKRKRLTRSSVVEEASGSEYEEEGDEEDEHERKLKKGRTKSREFDGWASKELLDFIQTTREDPKKPLSRLTVNKLLWNYVEGNKLLNSRRRGQITCDERLQKLFGKKSVGRFEMMKLLSSHLAPKQATFAKHQEFQSGDENVGEIDNSEDNRLGRIVADKQRKSRKRSDEFKLFKPGPGEYAAVDVNNINLIYLKRSLLDDLRADPEFESKVVGAFVRIRVPGMVNKSDTCYRLVQVVGVKQIYDTENSKKLMDVLLEIINLRKREEITVDSVSSQDFTEEECQRLRQSVKYGFLKSMTVGELEEKAKALQEVKVKDWFETELLRLSHLRDRASEKGHKRELRECVEKLQLLSSPEEKERQLKAPLEINADSHMDPNYESDKEEMPVNDSQESQNQWEKGPAAKVWEKSNSFSSMEKNSNNWDNGSSPEAMKSKASGWGQKDSGKDSSHFVDKQGQGWSSSFMTNDKNMTNREWKRGWGDESESADQSSGWNQQTSFGTQDDGWGDDFGSAERNLGWNSLVGFGKKDGSLDKGPDKGIDMKNRADVRLSNSRVDGSGIPSTFDKGSIDWRGRPGTHVSPSPASGFSPGVIAPGNVCSTDMTADIEREKIWYYQDPTKTIQGPFSMEQLRKWEKTKLFPLDLRVWRKENEDESILLTDALLGRFHKNFPMALPHVASVENYSQGGWGATVRSRDAGSTSIPMRSGASWQEKGGRAGWDQDGFAGASNKASDGSGWGSSWAVEKRGEDNEWGVKSENLWTSHLPGEFPRPGDEGRQGSYRGGWGVEANHRGPDQYRFDKPGNEGRLSRKKDVPCRFFARGMCKKGQSCEFKH